MRSVVITGATSGIGLAAAKLLTHRGFCVIGIGRNEEHCRSAEEQIKAEEPSGKFVCFAADLMQQREVLRLFKELSSFLIENCCGRLDALVNNAGCIRSRFTTTEEGYEQQFALNHLAGFLLTYKLLPFIQKAGGRVIMTGSGSHKGIKIHWDDVMLQKRYDPLTAYKQSKLCNILFARGLNDRFGSEGVRAYVVDPGLVNTDIGNKQTGGIVDLVWKLRKKHGVPPEVPAKTYAFLIEEEPAPEGLYFYLCRENKYSREVTGENANRLFLLSEQLCGINYGDKEAAA
jgi:NAD(P)-dependent dehydrogenase (short-subunit alcohol dehydrogenase family)